MLLLCPISQSISTQIQQINTLRLCILFCSDGGTIYECLDGSIIIEIAIESAVYCENAHDDEHDDVGDQHNRDPHDDDELIITIQQLILKYSRLIINYGFNGQWLQDSSLVILNTMVYLQSTVYQYPV